jgi:hypothetical protein
MFFAPLVVPVTNPVAYPEPAQRGFPSPLWDGFKGALGKLPGRLWGPAYQQAREPQGSPLSRAVHRFYDFFCRCQVAKIEPRNLRVSMYLCSL